MKKTGIILISLISLMISGCDYYPLSRGDEVYVIQKIEKETEEKDKNSKESDSKTEDESESKKNDEKKDEDQNKNPEDDDKDKEDLEKDDSDKENTEEDTNQDDETEKSEDEKVPEEKNPDTDENKDPECNPGDEDKTKQDEAEKDPDPDGNGDTDKPEDTDKSEDTDKIADENPDDSNPEDEKKPEIVPPVEVKERLWNILVYMAADNNLESSAIEDLCEMELSELNTDSVSVFVLLDRNEAYDITNGNWSGTKLLKLKTGKKSENKFIQSEELDCKDLGLIAGEDRELDMSSPYVLSDTIEYLQKRYPAHNYGLIMWGHGTGWRNDSTPENTPQFITGGYKGFAYDETSRTYMTLKQFGNALKTGLQSNKFGFVGFDTCFGAELEVMYEIRNYTDFSAGSEGLLMNSGWNYKDFFNAIQSDNEKSSESICKSLSNGFKKWYENAPGASFSVVNLKNMTSYFEYFDKYMQSVSELIDTRAKRDDVIGVLYSDPVSPAEKYTYGTQNNDVYLDVCSVVNALDCYFADNDDLQKCSTVFQLVEKSVVVESWNSLGTKGGLGVYFHTLGAGNLLSISHPVAYIKGKTNEQIAFVTDSLGYVPGVDSGKSLLEKLFYEAFE